MNANQIKKSTGTTNFDSHYGFEVDLLTGLEGVV